MVEAGIVLPVIILTIMLLLRLFVFYLQIMSAGVQEHLKVLNAWDSFRGKTYQKYEISRDVTLIKGGILQFNVGKKLESEAYFYNEDNMVRTSAIFK